VTGTVAISADQFARELRAFDGRRSVVKAMRRGLSTSARPVLRGVRAYAVAILPARGGLGPWVAAATMSWQIRYSARSAGIKLRGRRGSARGRSDLQRIDAGQVRHPSWGRRGRGQWKAQAVPPGWWSKPLEQDTVIEPAVSAAVDRALDEIRR
jgi:hypothetical protein